MEVNFFGLINCTRRALEVMREQKPAGGVIQQVTSIGGLNGVPTFSVYCASKFAVEVSVHLLPPLPIEIIGRKRTTDMETVFTTRALPRRSPRRSNPSGTSS